MKKIIVMSMVFGSAAYSQVTVTPVRDTSSERMSHKVELERQWTDANSAPVEFPNGIAISDSSATNPVYEIGVENGAVVTWVVHASPYDPAVAESNRVAALTERSTLRHDLRVMKGAAQTNKAQAQAVEVSNTSSTAQVRSAVIDLRRELIDANDTIIELTRLVRRLLKEQNP